MTLLVLVAILLFTPTKVEATVDIHNLECQLKVQLVLMFCLPFSIVIFNMRDKPWEFKVKTWGKTVSMGRLLSRIKKMIEKKPGKFRIEQIKTAGYVLTTVKKYLKSVELGGRIGIKDRADYTAVIAEALNGLVLGSGIVQGVKKMSVCLCPEYTMSVADIHGKCIISVNAANIIHESIRYYLQRRK